MAVATCLLGFSNGKGRSEMVQSRMYQHLDYAQDLVEKGRVNEAQAYAELMLMREDIKVFVDRSNLPRDMRSDALRALMGAAELWESALNREVNFRFTTREEADVIVAYTGVMKFGGREAAGNARWSRQVQAWSNDRYTTRVTAYITLRTHKPNGGMMNYSQMRHTAAHEFGHILGLEDSGRQGDIMGPLLFNRPVMRASDREIEGLLAFRDQVRQVLAKADASLEATIARNAEKKQEVSWSAAHRELETAPIRNNTPRRRNAAVRRPVRNRKAARRARSSGFGGMANPFRRL
ncbi:MAG: matrixin family metalloprotease [Armatimonadetes bacterium]|nr:matrixin family metalloprotease [Armatimonadota bacterium]